MGFVGLTDVSKVTLQDAFRNAIKKISLGGFGASWLPEDKWLYLTNSLLSNSKLIKNIFYIL